MAIKKAFINWVIPPKQPEDLDGVENRVIIVNGSGRYVINKQKNIKHYFSNNGDESKVDFDDFCLKYDRNISEDVSKYGNVYLSRFINGGNIVNLYVGSDYKTGEIIPFATITNRFKNYFFMLTNNSKKNSEIFSQQGHFVGYLPYNINKLKLITVGNISDGSIPLYCKSGKVFFKIGQDRDKTVEYTAKNYVLYNSEPTEYVRYRRLFSVESRDMIVNVKYMVIDIDDPVYFSVFSRFLVNNKEFNVKALKNLRENFSELKEDKGHGNMVVKVNTLYQINILLEGKNDGQRSAIGYTYVQLPV